MSNDKASPVSTSNLTARAEIEIFNAFDSIHSLGVIHGDIRADNILVAEEGNAAWIIDFESAEIVTERNDVNESQFFQESITIKELLKGLKTGGNSGSSCLKDLAHGWSGTEVAFVGAQVTY